MHEKHLLHADLKAANVLLNDAANWCLGDFGSSVKFGEKIVSCTESWYPGPIMFQPAEPKYDWGLMVVLLAMEIDKANWSALTGASSPAKIQKELLLAQCQRATHTGLKQLLAELLKDAHWV
ncbi:hypothetical protein WJX72_010118 [[Myrmecia] bisecta]|uniref:Protein kinase domain-containing protein n=1 Tax=[Myrmecia] bisecta TaxID=41462 RepID=A0AAW1QSF4_9CHLO